MNWEALFWGIIGGNVAVITAIIGQWLGWRKAMKEWKKARREG